MKFQKHQSHRYKSLTHPGLLYLHAYVHRYIEMCFLCLQAANPTVAVVATKSDCGTSTHRLHVGDLAAGNVDLCYMLTHGWSSSGLQTFVFLNQFFQMSYREDYQYMECAADKDIWKTVYI